MEGCLNSSFHSRTKLEDAEVGPQENFSVVGVCKRTDAGSRRSAEEVVSDAKGAHFRTIRDAKESRFFFLRERGF